MKVLNTNETCPMTDCARREELVEKLAKACWVELEYEDVVNERTEEVDYELIVDCVLRLLEKEGEKI